MNNPSSTATANNGPTPEEPQDNLKTRRLGRLGAVVGAGVIAGLFAVGATTFASAQTDSTPATDAEQAELGDIDVQGGHSVMSFELDDCLEGVLEGHFDGDSAMIDEATMDAAFEECGVPEMSDDGFGVAFAMASPLDEAYEAELDEVFERFDACFEAAVPGGAEALESGDLDEATEEAALESCESILDELPNNVFVEEMFLDGDFADGEFIEMGPELDAVFERFDACFEAAVPGGVEALESGDLDEATEEAALESCESILDELPEGASVIFEGDFDEFEFEFDCDPDDSSEEGSIESDGADDEGSDA